jgi:hypothetical protein
LFYCPHRTLAHARPDAVAGLNASQCNVILAIDRMENEMSMRRASSWEAQRSNDCLALDDPMASVMLWTLAGVNVIVTNQWHTSCRANHRVVMMLMTQLAANVSMGTAVKNIGPAWYTRVMERPPPDAVTAALDQPARMMVHEPLMEDQTKDRETSVHGTIRSSHDRAQRALPSSRLKGRIRYNVIVYGVPHVTYEH